MDGLDAGVLAVHGATQMHEAAVVEGGAVLGAGGDNVLKLRGHHGGGDFGILDRESPAKAAASVGVFEWHLGQAADFGKKAVGAFAKMEGTDSVATGVVSDAVMEAGADVFHAELVDEELAELVDAGKQRGELVAQLLVSKFLKQGGVLVADHGYAGGGGNQDGFRVLVKTHEALGLGERLGTETGVGMHLATAGLLGQEID